MDVKQNIVALLQQLNIESHYAKSPVAAAFYLVDTLPAGYDLMEVSPEAILIYDQVEDRIVTHFLKLNNGEYIYDSTYYAITSIYSSTDVIDIMNLNFLKSQEIIAIADLSRINQSIYLTELQIRLNELLLDENYISLGGSPSSGCQDANPDCSINSEGYCIPQERQTGQASYSCLPTEDKCTRKNEDTRHTFFQARETNPTRTNEFMYTIRDEVLIKYFKTKKYYDDYYYGSTVLHDTPITLNMALVAVEIFNTDFFENLASMEKPEYQDKIPITPAIKSLILELCESSKQVSSDQRYRKIIDQIKTDVETFENKPIHEIKTLL